MGEVDGVCREVLERMGSMLMGGVVRVELVGAWACRLRATLICRGVSHTLPGSGCLSRPPLVRCLSRPLPVTVFLTPSPCHGVSHTLSLWRCLSCPVPVSVSLTPSPCHGVSHTLPGSRCLTPSPCRTVLTPGWHPEPSRSLLHLCCLL